jgi:hypothetical protein
MRAVSTRAKEAIQRSTFRSQCGLEDHTEANSATGFRSRETGGTHESNSRRRTVKRCCYQSHRQLKEHLQAFLMAYNFDKRFKTPRGLTPYQFICQSWQKQPTRFQINPFRNTVGLNVESAIGTHSLSHNRMLPDWIPHNKHAGATEKAP